MTKNRQKKSIKEIYDFAMITEDDAESLYKLLSQVASEEYIQTIFAEMAKKEKKHHEHYLKLKQDEIRRDLKKDGSKSELSDQDLEKLSKEYSLQEFQESGNQELSDKIFGKADVVHDFKKLEDLEEAINLIIKYKLKMVMRLVELGKAVRFEDKTKFQELLNEEKKDLKELLDMRSVFLGIFMS